MEKAGEALAAERRRSSTQAEEIRALAGEIAGGRERIAELEQVSDRLAECVVEREHELRAIRAELADASQRREQSLLALETLTDELEDLRRQARGQATRIRMSALREAAELSDRLAQLARTPGSAGEGLLESIRESVRRLSGDGAEEQAEARREPTPDGVYEGAVEIDVGPLGDFAKLVGFEDAARSIGAAADISIKRFSGGRATLAMTLSEPVALLDELERRSHLGLRVRDTRPDRLVLDVDDQAAA